MTLHPFSAPLPRRALGATGLLVTPLRAGCAPLGDMPATFGYAVSTERALATIHAILDGPITFVDTAASYGDGESERRIGHALRERGRLPAGVVLDTKADYDLRTDAFDGDRCATASSAACACSASTACNSATCMTPSIPPSRQR